MKAFQRTLLREYPMKQRNELNLKITTTTKQKKNNIIKLHTLWGVFAGVCVSVRGQMWLTSMRGVPSLVADRVLEGRNVCSVKVSKKTF